MTSHSPAVAAHLASFAAAVRDSPHNLLSDRAMSELEERHIAESAAFASTLPHDAEVLDLGTGGGFPGMVIAITRPDLKVTLLDATAKKIAFLQEFAATAGIHVETMHGRAEELHQAIGRSFDVVTARAVAPLDRLVGWALPFLRPGGALHAIKGARWADELQAALPVIRRAGARVVGVPGRGSPAASSTSDDAMPRVVIIRMPG